MPAKVIEAKAGSYELRVGEGLGRIRDRVLSGEVVILKGALPKARIVSMREAVFGWGLATPPECRDLESSGGSWHEYVCGAPEEGKSARLWHAFAFVLRPSDRSGELERSVAWLFEEMRTLFNDLTGLDAGFEPDHRGRALRPQIFHYPSGGGFLARERHHFEPTIINQIVGLSSRGEDFYQGGTVFTEKDERISTEEVHEIGDICLFRADMWHEVGLIDAQAELNWLSPKGRWTAVMPIR